MFGNNVSSSGNHSNIFNASIQQSHNKLFGGDRSLSTKDITGAQPRQFTKHVWGHFQTNSYNNQLSYNPQQSSLLSPILGDNVQPLNRAIPNSSGMLFRNNFNNKNPGSPPSITSPSAVQMSKSSAALLGAIHNNNNSSSNNNYTQTSVNSPYQLVQRQPQSSSVKPRNSIVPPSQIKEQSIFYAPQYSIHSDYKLPQKPANNLTSQSAMVSPTGDRSGNLGSPINSSVGMASLRNNRSPDSIVHLHPDQKEYKREMISSYQLGRQYVQSDTPFIDESLRRIQDQDSTPNPLFSQNRNYGPDSVLYTEQSAGAAKPNVEPQSPYQQVYTHTPAPVPTDLGADQQEKHSPPVQNTFHQPQSPSANLQAAAAASRVESNEGGEYQGASEQPLTTQPHQHQQQYHFRSPIQSSPYLRTKKPSYPDINQMSGVKLPSIAPQQQAKLPQQDLPSIRQATKSPLTSNKDATTNSAYGTYLELARPTEASAIQLLPMSHSPTKIPLYQSKRDNFLYSHQQAPSSENRGELNASQSAVASRNQQAALQRKELAVRRGFNIIGNYPVGSVSKGDLSSKSVSNREAINQLAGVQNSYAESTNVKSQQQPKTPMDVKLFDPKALKNLSNVKIY